ncbi:hypothetical protein [Cryobacterium tepidiphilum]|uniref:DUF624 domain-containing protein n=1 Tax=Cryobacterium tepidiphilum TaxID=2486026 RepID=A0A3M8LNG2_9MICO|nr:hypothetical protein [Cryobacterium tepidiphilum]RNE67067.1 hypothetical protein EEJ31_02390 [Cryobacterium tepidiphilum]
MALRRGRGPREAAELLTDEPAPRWPGARRPFALFGEVLLVGILVTVLALPLVTLPVALAAGIRHLARFIAGDASPMAAFWADVRSGIVGSLGVGIGFWLLVGMLAVDGVLAQSGLLPGGSVVGVIVIVLLVVLPVILTRAAAEWEPGSGWALALRAGLRAATDDLRGTLYLVAAVGLLVVLTWQLIPLVIPGFGCLVFAATAVRLRRLAQLEA